jgi:hypothetical protein
MKTTFDKFNLYRQIIDKYDFLEWEGTDWDPNPRYFKSDYNKSLPEKMSVIDVLSDYNLNLVERFDFIFNHMDLTPNEKLKFYLSLSELVLPILDKFSIGFFKRRKIKNIIRNLTVNTIRTEEDFSLLNSLFHIDYDLELVSNFFYCLTERVEQGGGSAYLFLPSIRYKADYLYDKFNDKIDSYFAVGGLRKQKELDFSKEQDKDIEKVIGDYIF